MKLASIPGPWRAAAVAAAIATVLSGGLAAAQLGDPGGPGQAVSQPAALCARTVSCTYSERNSLGPEGGYRFQSLLVCGANCATQYWVSDMATGKLLLGIDPVRGGGLVASGRQSSPQDTHPPVRVLVPDYQPSDAACCPSGYKETTYTYDAASNSLTASASNVVPSQQFPGWQELRQQWEQQGFFPVFPGA